MRSNRLTMAQWQEILPELDYQTRLAMQICLSTGLRIGDVLDLKADESGVYTITERKTGKLTTFRMPEKLQNIIMGLVRPTERVFSVSRSTVYRKVRKYGTTPHGARKTFARALFDRTGDLARVQKAMNHSNLQLTGYYAFSNNDLT